MSEKTDELNLTRKQRLAGNLTAGGCVIAAGLILLLAGTGVIPASVRQLAVPVLLSAVGAALILTALIQRNSVSLWISFLFLVPALVSFLAAFTPAGYAQLYPLYIAAPAIASLCTMPMSGSYAAHGKSMLFFGLIAGLFGLESSGLVGWGVVLPLVVVFVGLMVVYVAVMLARKEKSEEEEDNA